MSYMPLEVMAPSAMSPPPNPNLQTAYPQQWYATPNTTTPGQPANPARVFASIYRCCCCFDLRTGSIIIAILHIVVSLGILSLVLWNYQGDLSTAIPLSTLLDCVAGVAVGICLLVGVIKSNASAILVYLILSPINFIIRCVVWSLSFGIFAVLSIFWDSHKRHQIDEGHVLGIFIIGITITVMALSIYFWFCVYRFYQLTKYGKVTSCA